VFYGSHLCEGDAKGRVFTFPIPTYNITSDFDWKSPNSDLLFEMTAKYGLPYFQNFINSELDPHMIRSMCCRLRLDVRELLKRGNGLFGSAEQTGSIGVVTINMARLGYKHAGDEEELEAELTRLMNLAKVSLELKRKEIQGLIDAGLFPYTKRYLGTLRNHFSTIGVNGINEMVRNFSDDEYDITDPRGHALAARTLDVAREVLVRFQSETNHLYNLEATPAEGATYRFAREDIKRFPESCMQALKRSRTTPIRASCPGLYDRSLRSVGDAGRPPEEVHRRYRVASVHG
jgi:ribonucleoside-triphosphate reductase